MSKAAAIKAAQDEYAAAMTRAVAALEEAQDKSGTASEQVIRDHRADKAAQEAEEARVRLKDLLS